MNKFYQTILSVTVMAFTVAVSAADYPGAEPGPASGTKEGPAYVLKNNLIRAEWTLKNGRLSAPTVKNIGSGEVLQAGGNLFGISLTKQQVDEDWVYLGIRLKDEAVEAVASMDGKNWNMLAKLPAINGSPKLLRVGKTDNTGGDKDYGSVGEMGSCELPRIERVSKSGMISNPPTPSVSPSVMPLISGSWMSGMLARLTLVTIRVVD